jgi:hypothetical protein
MDQRTRVDLIPRDTKIASVVSDYNIVPNLVPLSRLIEPLVDPPIEAEGSSADLSSEDEVVETFFESRKSTKL